MNIDVGTNLFSLGFLWLIFHYILPIIIGIVLLVLAYFAVKWLFDYLGLTVGSLQELMYAIIIAGMVFLLFVLW